MAESAPGKLAHVSVTVSDVAAADRFYGEMLGFERLARPDFGFPGSWYSLGQGLELHIIVNDALRRPDAERLGFEVRYPHFAIRVDDADRMQAALEAKGLKVNELFSSPTGLRQLFVKDDDGNMVEFIGPGRPR
ncbi:catechol 2,3-dioxygenase-like lactoylglutathione lyase family enzyme [Stella humosa]|uniref:Catechol 2,3-dioxygenase-like lactoylglutathione lyase family enzyme n=1 Tax=Stella humosa TaxID=94 RepID=A0A3N1MAB0_9PROT|nr:VOC family protein [Stella humosa]ROP99636.1 catechol 2,3-dioxygenase-like lactoylglutathione lyase family enzyme [Stella humosa]BBK31139.1 glyoxalase [Stella humosa]